MFSPARLPLVLPWLLSISSLACGDDDAPPSAETGDTGTTGEATSSGTDGLDESSGGPAAVCGDGMVGGDEQCDDGNEEDGDGCNVDCRPSGTIFWTVELTPAAEDSTDLPDLSPAGDRVALVTESGGDSLYQWTMQVFDREGSEQWLAEVPSTPMMGGDSVIEGTGLPDGSLVIGYFPDGAPPTRLRKYTPTGAIDWELDPDPTLGTVSRVFSQPDGLLAKSNVAGSDWLSGYSLAGAEQWRAMLEGASFNEGAPNPAGGMAILQWDLPPVDLWDLRLLDSQGVTLGQWQPVAMGRELNSEEMAGAPGGYWFSQGSNGTSTITRLGLDAQEELSFELEGVTKELAGMPDGGVVIATGNLDEDTLRRFDSAGTLRWELVMPDRFVSKLAAGTDGSLWIAGSDRGVNPSRIWLSGVTP